MLVQKTVVEWTHSITIWVYFAPPHANTNFNPIFSMHLFFIEMLKYEPSITVLINPINQHQIKKMLILFNVLSAKHQIISQPPIV